MKRLVLSILGVLGAVMAFVVLVPEFTNTGLMDGRWRPSDPELAALQDELSARQDSIRTMTAVYERLVAIEFARGTRSPGRAASARLTFFGDDVLSAKVRNAFETRIREELAPLGDSLKYPVRVHIVHDSAMIASYRRIVVLPRDATEPCVLVLIVSRPLGRDVLPQANDRVIGTCGFYAAFGAPGPGMAEWLVETRGELATADVEMPLMVGPKKHQLSGGDILNAPEIASCVSGRDGACIESWKAVEYQRRRNARDAGWQDAVRGTVRAFPFSAVNSPGRNLADLRVAMTDARFAELWGSDLAPIEAYERIEGRSMAPFIRERWLKEIEPHQPGPLRAELPLALSILLGVAAAALAIRFTKRRRS